MARAFVPAAAALLLAPARAANWIEVGGGCCPYTEPTIYDQNLPNCGKHDYCGDKCKAMGDELGGAYVFYWQSGPWCVVLAEGNCPYLTYDDKAHDDHCNPSWAGVTTWHLTRAAAPAQELSTVRAEPKPVPVAALKVASTWFKVGGGCCPYTEPKIYDQNLPNCGQHEYCGDKCKAMGDEKGGAYVTYWQNGPWCSVLAEGNCPSLTHDDAKHDGHCDPSWAGVTTWHRVVKEQIVV